VDELEPTLHPAGQRGSGVETVAAKGGRGRSCDPDGGPIGGVYGIAWSKIFIEPPPYAQQRRRRGERGTGVTKGS
jgi:hypothetical protein